MVFIPAANVTTISKMRLLPLQATTLSTTASRWASQQQQRQKLISNGGESKSTCIGLFRNKLKVKTISVVLCLLALAIFQIRTFFKVNSQTSTGISRYSTTTTATTDHVLPKEKTELWHYEKNISMENCSMSRNFARKFSRAIAQNNQDEHGILMVSCTAVTYRAPKQRIWNSNSRLLIGVLSTDVRRRDVIRNTWAKNLNNVYFLVSSSDEIQAEYEKFQDLISTQSKKTEAPVDDASFTLHMGTFFSVIHDVVAEKNNTQHSSNEHQDTGYDYLFLTSDHFSIDVPALQSVLLSSTTDVIGRDDISNQTAITKRPDYWGGNCSPTLDKSRDTNETHLLYCNRTAGYALSREFVDCITNTAEQQSSMIHSHLATVSYMPIEDVAVGMLAARCSVRPVTNTGIASVIRKMDEDEDMETIFEKYSDVNPYRRKSMCTTNCTPSYSELVGPLEENHRDDGELTISCERIQYRAPKFRIRQSNSRILIGVLSTATGSGPERRDAIRRTWANHTSIMGEVVDFPETPVYFLVAGLKWINVEAEYELYQDLIWIAREEVYDREVSVLTFKTESFLSIVHTSLATKDDNIGTEAKRYDYLFKTDDDSYVDVVALYEELLSNRSDSNENRKVDFWGKCNNGQWPPHRNPFSKWYISTEVYPELEYPPFCVGSGFALSYSFVQCIIEKSGGNVEKDDSHLAMVRYMPNEDVAIGILAARCNIMPTNDNRIVVFRKKDKDSSIERKILPASMEGKIVQHRVSTVEDMMAHHQSARGIRGISNR